MNQIEQRAREFIDSVLSIGARYGHPSDVARDDYERAVADCAAAARRVAIARERNPA